jgi:hypothetical protein
MLLGGMLVESHYQLLQAILLVARKSLEMMLREL